MASKPVRESEGNVVAVVELDNTDRANLRLIRGNVGESNRATIEKLLVAASRPAENPQVIVNVETDGEIRVSRMMKGLTLKVRDKSNNGGDEECRCLEFRGSVRPSEVTEGSEE